jgi:hypothetical protein
MLPVAYLHCERCNERRLFTSAEEAPPIDPNLAMCDACGFAFGYCLIDEVVAGKIETVARPRLAADVLDAGIRAYGEEYTARLAANGQTLARVRAQRQLEAAIANPNLDERRRLTHPTVRGALTPEEARLVLSPTPQRNRRPGGEVE